jgi:hypothetical protein
MSSSVRLLQWGYVETAEGRYNFTRIDGKLADLESRGLSTTRQIHGIILDRQLKNASP